jgi:hypothetical protein
MLRWFYTYSCSCWLSYERCCAFTPSHDDSFFMLFFDILRRWLANANTSLSPFPSPPPSSVRRCLHSALEFTFLSLCLLIWHFLRSSWMMSSSFLDGLPTSSLRSVDRWRSLALSSSCKAGRR